MSKNILRILLEIFSRDIITVSIVYFLAINISNKTDDIRVQTFCWITGLILIWWTLLPGWDFIKDYKLNSQKETNE